jgi:hypothetical protein
MPAISPAVLHEMSLELKVRSVELCHRAEMARKKGSHCREMAQEAQAHAQRSCLNAEAARRRQDDR